jgi:hypothetical protein
MYVHRMCFNHSRLWNYDIDGSLAGRQQISHFLLQQKSGVCPELDGDNLGGQFVSSLTY